MSNNVCFLNEFNGNKIERYTGIGITNVNVYPHFNINDKDCVNETIEVSKYTKLIALTESSFVRIGNNQFNIIGEHYIIEKGKIK